MVKINNGLVIDGSEAEDSEEAEDAAKARELTIEEKKLLEIQKSVKKIAIYSEDHLSFFEYLEDEIIFPHIPELVGYRLFSGYVRLKKRFLDLKENILWNGCENL